jgi:hypothetical protein
MNSVSNQIMKRIRGKGRGWVFTPKDFVDLGTRASIDMALSRLASTGSIRRVGRGLYDYPIQHDKLGNLTPDPAKVAEAISKQTGDRVALSGASAANRLGLSTQVPSKISFATSGRSTTKRAAGRSFALKHSRAPVLDNAPDTANAVLQAIAHIGKDNLDSDRIRSFAMRIQEKDMRALRRARAQMPGWMSDAILKIERQRDG